MRIFTGVFRHLATSLILSASAVFAGVFVGVSLSQAETSEKASALPVFRFHVPTEPASLDPLLVVSTDASYFLNNVMRGLYSYADDKGLVLEDAKSCRLKLDAKKIQTVECELADDAKWSDGSSVVADDYVRGFRRLIGAGSRSAAVELLRNLKNAGAVHSGKLPTTALGLRAIGSRKLEFEFEKVDPDFLYKLTSSVLVPLKTDAFPSREKSSEAVVNGPYRVVSWTSGRRVRLEPNVNYSRGLRERPPVEVLFLEDDETAYNLYAQGELSYLRRLPTSEIPRAKLRKDFYQIPIARFDYMGFGPGLTEQPHLREALMYGAEFKELGKIYDALGMPGCPSLPRRLMADEPCLMFDLARAKKALAKVSPDVLKRRFTLGYSKLGGDDVKRGAEWWQAQWKKHLGLTFDLESAEQGVYIARLRTNAPDVFRKGIGLDRPTCLAGMETFITGGAENFVKFENTNFEKTVTRLSVETSESKKKRLCTDAMNELMAQNRLIPLGRIHFTLLASPKFTGWKLNEMNQLDLARLRAAR